jgi:protein cornichon
VPASRIAARLLARRRRPICGAAMTAALALTVDVTFWATLFLGTALLLFCMVYALVLYSDLSRDLVNPTELCDLLNRVVPWEYSGHVCLAGLLLLRGYFIAALTHAPLIAFHANRYSNRVHLLDNTQIFSDMPKERSVCGRKLAFYLLSFFLYLYLFIQYCIS